MSFLWGRAAQKEEGITVEEKRSTEEKRRESFDWAELVAMLVIAAIVIIPIVFGINTVHKVNDLGARIDKIAASGNTGNTSSTNGAGSDTVAPCPSAPEASQLVAGNDTALVREGGEACLFEWRNAPLATSDTITCPDGWACELDLAGPEEGLYVYGGGGSYQIDAGSFRPIDAYPAGDPIHDPCSALAKSRAWLKTEKADPTWTMSPGNFSCPGETSGSTSNKQGKEGQGLNCPVFGGMKTEPIGDGGCKYGPTTVVTERVPKGWKVLYWNGSAAVWGAPGETITTGEASFYPEGS